MSTGRRGHRGTGDRGGRGSRANSGNPFRGGGSGRGRFNGSDASMQDTTPHAPRGGRGRSNARGDSTPFRGRGTHQQTNATSKKFSTGFDSSSTTKSAMNSTPFPDHDYAKRLEYLRNDRPRLREELVRRRLMNPDGPMNLADSVELHGICTDMCPEYERVRRIVENDYKAAECTPETAHGPRAGRIPDETRMVKAFTRSAAGQEEELVSDKRTPGTCLKTLDYMFSRIDEDGLDFLYQWLWDRTRSVRKDMVGKIKPEDIPAYLTSVEQCARFHLVSLHAMAGSNSPNYDHGTDHGNDLEQLRNCFTSLRHRYDDNEKAGTRNANKPEFVAYDMILSLTSRGNNTQLEDNPERYNQRFSHHRRVRSAYLIRQTGLAVMAKVSESFPVKKQNWANFWQAVNDEDVSFLMACAAEISFNQIRYHIMETLRLAYKPKKSGKPGPVNDWTPENLMHALGFDNHDQVREFCGHYGLGFVLDEQGQEVLDVQSMPPNRLEKPPEMRPQYFSKEIVEPKRMGRSFRDVIQSNLKENDQEQGESLFVPNTSLSRGSNVFKPPTTSPFTWIKPSPFASPAQNGTTSTSISPGVFDPSKNAIKFANNNNNPFATPTSSSPPTSTLLSNNAFASPSPTPTPTTSNLFAPTPTTAIPKANPPPSVFPNFSFPQLSQPSPLAQPAQPGQDEERRKAEEQNRKLEEERKAEEEKRAQEERARQARAAEEQRRLQEEEQQRQRLQQEELERQRRIQEEAQRQAQAERQRQWEAEQLRRNQEEAERYEREERARAYTGLTNSLLMDEDEGLLKQFLDHKIQLMIKEVAQEMEEQRLKQWAEERYQQRRLMFVRAVCARWWEQVQKKKKRRAARNRREKLKALRAIAIEEQLALEEKVSAKINGTQDSFKKPDTPASVPHQHQSLKVHNGISPTKKSERALHEVDDREKRVVQKPKINKEREPVIHPDSTSVENNHLNVRSNDYSVAYYKSTAPIDRTETDWFKLRAMGLDPRAHRKRSHESVSSDEDESEGDMKRARRSTSSTFRPSLPPPKTDEERFARLHALKESFNRTSPISNSGGRNRSASIITKARELLLGSPAPLQSRPESPEHGHSASNSGFVQSTSRLSTFGRSIGAAPPGEAPAYKSRPSRFVPPHLYGKGGEAARAYREECRKRSSTDSLNGVYDTPNESPQVYPPTSMPARVNANEGQEGAIEIDDDDEDLIVYSSSDGEEEQETEEVEQVPQNVYGHQQALYIDDAEDEEDESEGEEEDPNEGWDAYDQNEEEYDDEEEEEDYEEDEGDEQFTQQAQRPGATQADAIELSDSD